MKMMFQRMISFCRRIAGSKGFRLGVQIFLWLMLAICVRDSIKFLITLMNTGIPFSEALSILFEYLSVGYILLGVVIGLILFYVLRKKKTPPTEEHQEEEEENNKLDKRFPD